MRDKFWTVDNGVAVYGTDGETLITISGLKNPSAADGAISGLTLDETAKTVTVAGDLLDEDDVTITSDDYTLQLGDGMTISTTIPAHFEGNKYKLVSNTAGYALSEDKKSISCKAAVGSSDLFELSGVKSTDGITVEGTTVTITAANLDAKKVKISGDYKLALADDVDTVAETINDWSTLSNGNVAYLEGGRGSYYALSDNKIIYKVGGGS